jgi:WD40 repeat protein
VRSRLQIGIPIPCLYYLFFMFWCAQLNGHGGNVSEMVWLNDNTLLTGSLDGTLRLWDIRGAVECGKIAVPDADEVLAVAASANGTLIAAGYGNTVGFWDVRTPGPVSRDVFGSSTFGERSCSEG